jgi:hypothetical protein
VRDRIVVNGIELGPNTDVVSVLRKQLLGGGIFSGRYDEAPEPGVRSVVRAAEGTSVEPRVVEAILNLLTDENPQVRAGAVEIAQHFADKFDASRLLRILNQSPELFVGIPQGAPGNAGKDLAWGLLRAMAAASNVTPPVISRLRQAVVNFPNGAEVLAGLTERDSDWVIEHAPEVIGSDKSRAKALLFMLRGPVLRERLIKSIPAESPRLREIMTTAISEEIRDEAERRRLLELLQ